MNKKEAFTFPVAFLTQINEYSNGGFILINFDAEKNPRVFFQFDDTLSSLALTSHTENWALAMKSVNQEMMTESVKESFEQDEGSENGDTPETS